MKRIEQCGRLYGEVTIHLVDYQRISMELESLLINVIGIVRPKNLMDGTPPRSFTHTFVLMKFLDGLDTFGEKTRVWHIHNDIFRYLPPQQLNLASMSSGYNLATGSGIYQSAPFGMSTHPGPSSSVLGPTHPPNLPLPSPPHYTTEPSRTEILPRNEPSSIYSIWRTVW